jgi:hypothetical protein
LPYDFLTNGVEDRGISWFRDCCYEADDLPLFDGEVRLVKNLTDLNHVAFVGGAPQRPFHKLIF